MLYNILAAADKTRPVGPAEAALYAALGFAVVFVGIAFLIFVVWLVGKIMSRADEMQKKKVGKKQAKQTVEPSIVSNAQTSDGVIDEETVAVISAAIMAYYQQFNPKCEFTVKRIKRI